VSCTIQAACCMLPTCDDVGMLPVVAPYAVHDGRYITGSYRRADWLRHIC